jgi:hypothetical protein
VGTSLGGHGVERAQSIAMRLLLTAVITLALAGCAGAAGTPSASIASSASPSATDEGSSPAASEAEASVGASDPGTSEQASAPPEAEETITGQLGFEDIEGGCVIVETDDGTRYEVQWPEGWEVNPATLELTDPDGQVVAEGGDTLTIEGRVFDGGSTCQIGPIFEAVAVEVEE